QSHRGDLASSLAHIEVWRAAKIDASIGEVDAALRVMGKTCKELLSHLHDMMRLTADAGHSSSHANIAALTKGSTVGITRQCIVWESLPSHDDASVESPGQGHPDRLVPVQITGKIAAEHCLQFLVVLLRLQRLLLLPLLLAEVQVLARECAIA